MRAGERREIFWRLSNMGSQGTQAPNPWIRPSEPERTSVQMQEIRGDPRATQRWKEKQDRGALWLLTHCTRPVPGRDPQIHGSVENMQCLAWSQGGPKLRTQTSLNTWMVSRLTNMKLNEAKNTTCTSGLWELGQPHRSHPLMGTCDHWRWGILHIGHVQPAPSAV